MEANEKETTIYYDTLMKVSDGLRFTVNLQKRNLKVDGKYVIKEGVYEGSLGIDKLSSENAIKEIENLYETYKISIPSERTENKRKVYFNALPSEELTDEDMMFSPRREIAQCQLELFVLLSVLNGSLVWDEIKEDDKHFFWRSKNDKDLIILKSWISQD